jgi:hypothetical protein
LILPGPTKEDTSVNGILVFTQLIAGTVKLAVGWFVISTSFVAVSLKQPALVIFENRTE